MYWLLLWIRTEFRPGAEGSTLLNESARMMKVSSVAKERFCASAVC